MATYMGKNQTTQSNGLSKNQLKQTEQISNLEEYFLSEKFEVELY